MKFFLFYMFLVNVYVFSMNNENGLGLHYAVKDPNNKSLVQQLLTNGLDVNIKDANHETPLHLAMAIKNNKDIIELLLKNEADIEAKAKYGNTPLFNGVIYQTISNIELLLKHNANVKAVTNSGETLLHKAVKEPNNRAIVKLLLKYGVDINALNNNQETCLSLAMEIKDNKDIIELLLKNNADIEAKDKYGYTALFNGVIYQTISNIELLLEHKADAKTVNNSGETLLHKAVEKPDNRAIVELLLKYGADINALNNDGKTALHLAMEISNNINNIRLLLDVSEDSLEVYKKYSEIVQYNYESKFIKKEDYEIYKQLLKEKYQVKINEKLLIEYCNNGNQKEVQNLLQKGVNINAQDALGDTGLHKACTNGDLDMVDFLLSNNASTTIFNEKEETPLRVAISNNKVLVVKAIVSQKGLDDENWVANFLHAYALVNNQITSYFLEYFYENSDSLKIFNLININNLKMSCIDKSIIDKFLFIKNAITLKNIGTVPFYATMSEQLLNLGKTTKKYDIEVKFNLIEGNIYEATFNTGKIKKTMYLKANADNLGKINRFEFFEKQKNNSFKIKKSSAYNEDATYIKQKKGMVKNPNVSLFQDDFKVTYSEDFNELIISFKNPKEGNFTLSKSKKNETSITITPTSKASDKKTTNNKVKQTFIPHSEPQVLFNATDIQGHYIGIKDNIQYQVYIPLFNSENAIDIDITITQNNQQTKEVLKAIPQNAYLSKVLYTSLKPAVITKEGLCKSIVDGQQITFNGQIWTQKKIKNKVKPLCFTGPIKLDLKNKQLILLTSRGEITLTHQNLQEEPLEEEVNAEVNEVNQEQDNNDLVMPENEEDNDDTPTNSYELDSDDGSSDEELVDEVIEKQDAIKEVKTKKTPKSSKKYFELTKEDISLRGNLDSSAYNESSEKIVNRSWPNLQKKITPEVIVEEPKPKVSSLLHKEVLRPIKLNPNSSLDDCSLYNNEEPSKSIWFGKTKNKKIVINLGNFNQGFKRFAKAASWCSFYDSTLGEKNRLNGINAHCSYHRHEEKEYIYISHHGLFLIDKDNQGFIYLIKLPDQKDKNIIKYNLTKSFDKSAYDSYNYINPAKNNCRILDDIIDTENLFLKATDVKNNLITLNNHLELTYVNKKLSFSPRGNGTLSYNNKEWRKVINWDVQMINLDKAFIYIVFINNKNLPQTLSFKIDVNHEGSLVNIIKKS